MAVDEIQYSAVKQFAEAAAGVNKEDNNIVNAVDKLRIAAYNLYDGIYHNRQEALKIQVRGEDQIPIYMPSAKKIVEATSRYLCVGFDYYAKGALDDIQGGPDNSGGDTGPGPSGDEQPLTQDSISQASTIETYFASFFKREKIKAKFTTQKRYGLIRGDAIWYLTADPKKAQGQRLSLHELDPRQYFAIDDPSDNTRVIGCHIVDTVQDPRKPDDKNALVARRQTYRKVETPGANGDAKIEITSERTCWEMGKWDDRTLDPDELVRVPNPDQDMELQTLPPQITALPIYHIQNNRVPNASYGMSELAGIETLLFAINQAITDEDLTLIMQGLGMYATNAAPPQNSDGSEGDWNVGPGQVVEVGTDQKFERITGVTSLSPYAEHIKALDDAAMQGAGIPEIAAGAVDVAVAESGVALMIQMGPILAKNAEKELEWILTTDQMFFDITNMWLPAYEGIDPAGSAVQTIVDDPMPVNRDAKIQELILLYTSGVITLSMVVSGLMALGYSFPSNDPEQAAQMIKDEQKQKSIDMMGDPYALGDGGIDPNTGQPTGGGQGGNGGQFQPNNQGQINLGN